jgi:hypothetical protein
MKQMVKKYCKTCEYWGGSDSKGDMRTCYRGDIYSKVPLDKTHKDYCCSIGWVETSK